MAMAATADLPLNPEPGARVRRRMAGLYALRRDQDGAAAVEFGLVALPFFGLLFAILETALLFWTTQILETAVANASRTIYTGQFQSANDQSAPDIKAKFKAELCKHVVTLVTCDSPAVHVDVRAFKPGDTLPELIKDGKVNEAGFGYQPTQASEIVLVRVAVEYPLLVPMLNGQGANLGSGKRLIMASATFRNEPF
jgi:Flp pilus assembly protein TadG